ncbi:MAG: hypothetical protein HY556_00650 [Euryarchaeota archaeon]|nr:hypothetical protein [Euryarchaeota archaeon]
MRFSIWTAVSLLLVVFAVVFYAYMYSITGRWFEQGVYAVTVIPLGFGLAGLYLTTRGNPQ